MWQVWLVISGVLFIAEIITVGFLVFWFAIGALFAMIVSIFTDNVIIQTSVFLISSTLLLFLTKPFVKKLCKEEKVQTNAYSVIGKIGIVTYDIDNKKGSGQVKVGSESWSAISCEDTPIYKDSEIEVVEIKGVKLVVKPALVTANK